MAKTRIPKHGGGALAPRWRPGQSGNPGGRAKDDAGRIARLILSEPVPAKLLERINRKKRNGAPFAPGTTFLEVTLGQHIIKAAYGDVDSAKLVLGRAFGVPPKNLNLKIDDHDSAISDESIRQQLLDFLKKKAETMHGAQPVLDLPAAPAPVEVTLHSLAATQGAET